MRLAVSANTVVLYKFASTPVRNQLKLDGFRSLAVIQNGRCQLISRNGHPFNSFTDLRKELTAPGTGKTVLDGEIVCLDRSKYCRCVNSQ